MPKISSAFLGLYNREISRRLPTGALVVADNVDIDDAGGVVSREGYTLSEPLTNVTAAFATQDEQRLFVVDDGTLKLLQPGSTGVVLATGVSSDYIYWLEVAEYVLMSTGHIIGPNNQVTSWRVPKPEQPVVNLVSGSLPAGQYQVVHTYVDTSGGEGGASAPAIMNVADGSGLTVEPEYITGYDVRVYVTDTNGAEYYFYRESTAGSVEIATTEGLTATLDEAQLRGYPAPDGVEHLAFYEGRVWASEFSGDQTVIWYSEPYWWNLFDLESSYIVIPDKVTMMVGHSQGLLIATNDEIYVYTAEEALVRLAQYGTPDGVPYTQDDTGKIYIWSNQGLCEALPFQNLTEQKVSLAAGNVCYTKLVEQNGRRKVVIMTDGNGSADNTLF